MSASTGHSGREDILAGRTSLGIELGSTRIKACLIGSSAAEVLATGSFSWENRLEDGLWTYSLDEVWTGLQSAFADLIADVHDRYGVRPDTFGAIGVSAMMHGYLAFDAAGDLLAPFRTWRNTNTGPAAAELTELLGVNIPLRWSVAHLRQAQLDAEPHAEDVRFLTGYRDGWLEPTFDLQRDIVRVIRQVCPQRVLAQSPERNWDRIGAGHPDHLAAGEASVRAIYPAARNPFAWPELISEEGLEPWTVQELWLMAHPNTNHTVDITDVFDRKLAALRAHVSQTGHINRLVQDLLDLAQLEAGELTIMREKVNLSEFLARETEKMTTIALGQEKKLKFVLQKLQKNDRLPVVWADPVRLTQVFNNLITNAIRYAPEGSEIKIQAAARGRFSQFTIYQIKKMLIGIAIKSNVQLFAYRAVRAIGTYHPIAG